jgi:hypothetical protein
MTPLLFEEHQSFRQTWVWLMLAILLAISLGSGLIVYQRAPKGQVVPWIGSGIMLVVVLLFWAIEMRVQVDSEFIRIRYFPLWKKTIPLHEIARWEARTYQPILEYGGWGIRYGRRKGWAYNVSGDQGVQLELANGQRILIGSQRADELALAIGQAKGQA